RDRGAGHGDRWLLSQGEQEAIRESVGAGSDCERVSHGQPSRTGEFPSEEPHHRGNALGRRDFGREVFGVPGNVTQEVSSAPNLLIKQGAKLVTNAEDVIEELPTPVRAALVKAEAVESEQRNLLLVDGLSPVQRKLYGLLSAEESRHIDDIVDTSGLNSSEVLATLFDLEMQGIVRQLPGKQFSKVLL